MSLLFLKAQIKPLQQFVGMRKNNVTKGETYTSYV